MRNKYLIDANIFLHLYLEQGEESACRDLLNALDEGEIDAKTTLFHLDAAAIVMERDGMNQREIAEFYARVYQSQGIDVVLLGIKGRLNSLATDKQAGLDDSLIEQAMKELNLDKVITYDADFEEQIRTTPEQVLRQD